MYSVHPFLPEQPAAKFLFGPGTSANSRGDPRVAGYEEVWCGDVEKICHKLCYAMECSIHDSSHLHVQKFINSVDDRENAILDWESEGRSKNQSKYASFVSCAGTVLSGGGLYVVLTAADPEPVSKTILAFGGIVIAGVACAGSMVSFNSSGTEQLIQDNKIDKQTMIAKTAFDYLRRFAEEEILDA